MRERERKKERIVDEKDREKDWVPLVLNVFGTFRLILEAKRWERIYLRKINTKG